VELVGCVPEGGLVKFTKVKRNPKSYDITLSWVTETLGGDVVESSLHSADLPRPEFIDAMQAFRNHVLDICELPADYAADLVVTGISLSENDSQGRGIVVTAQKTVARAAAPVIINTPHVPEINEHGASLRAAAMDAIDTLVTEARLFQQGTRAQADMFAEEGKPPSKLLEAHRKAAEKAEKAAASLTLSSGGRSVTVTSEQMQKVAKTLRGKAKR
jgi:hypothetical protein